MAWRTRPKVFVQDKDLRAPLGLAVIGNRVIVSASPHLIVYTDENGDDTPDKKEILLTGFGGFDHDHGLHALVSGPDGRWYFNTGNAGPHVVTDRSGWTLRAGSLYTGGTPYNLKNQGGMVSDDGRVWTGGLGLRMEPDGTRLTVLAHNFRNAYELAVDSFGDLWQNDNDDQVMTCRMTWLMEGASAGYFSADGIAILAGRSAARAGYVHGALAPGRPGRAAGWRQHRRRVHPPASCATRETSSVSRYRGLLLSADAGRNVIFAFQREAARRRLRPRPVRSSCRASPRRTRTTSGTLSTTTGASGFGRVMWPLGPTARSTSPIGTIRSSAAIRCRTARATAASTASRRRDGRSTTPAIDLRTTAGQVQALLSPAVNVRSSGFERLTGEPRRIAAGSEDDP